MIQGFQRKSVLVVMHNDDVRRALASLLRTLDWHVVEVSDPKDADAAFTDNGVNFVAVVVDDHEEKGLEDRKPDHPGPLFLARCTEHLSMKRVCLFLLMYTDGASGIVEWAQGSGVHLIRMPYEAMSLLDLLNELRLPRPALLDAE